MSHTYRELRDKLEDLFRGLCLSLLFTSITGAGLWIVVRVRLFDDGWMDLLHNTTAIFKDAPLVWKIVFIQSIAMGALLTAWFTTWWLLHDRLPSRGDSHHRGASINRHDA